MGYKQWIVPILLKHKWSFIITAVLLIIQVSLEIIMTGLQKYVIDDIFTAGNYERLTPLLIVFGVVVVGYTILFTFVPYLTKKNETHIYASLSKGLKTDLHRLPMNHIQNERTAQYVQLLTSDTKKAAAFIGVDTFSGLRHACTITILIFIVGTINLSVLVFVLLLSAVYIVVGLKFSPKLRKLSKTIEESREDLLIHLEEGISSTKEVLSFNRLELEEKEYHSLFNRYLKKVIKEGKLMNKQLAISGPLRWGVRLAVFGFGGYELLQGNLSLGLFVIVWQFSSSLIDEIHSLFLFLSHVSINMAYLDRLKAVHDETQLSEGTIHLDEQIWKLSFENVSFTYNTHSPLVLDQLHLDIPIGKKIAFVGGSGGGKSTITQLLIRFFEPTEGRITVNGFNLRDLNRSVWSKKVAVVFQDPYILSDTILNNLTFGQEQTDLDKVKLYSRMAMIDSVIEDLPQGYNTVIGSRGTTLSGGQKQRVAITRALIRNAEILIFDEATSSLDMETERHVQHHIDQLREGKTTIIIAHRLSTIQNSDVIYVLDHGQIVSSGSHETLLKSCSVYKKLYNARMEEEPDQSDVKKAVGDSI
ncbi:ABC transporter ATP-binding protein [Paenibacillus xylanexedens]|uniref:ABC transporter ATP-binding protein n=1 Tax=Paenibacillus xylanexedens TaxID=528191 RepID=UPI003B026B54